MICDIRVCQILVIITSKEVGDYKAVFSSLYDRTHLASSPGNGTVPAGPSRKKATLNPEKSNPKL